MQCLWVFLCLEHPHKTFQQKSLLNQGSYYYAYSLWYGSQSHALQHNASNPYIIQ